MPLERRVIISLIPTSGRLPTKSPWKCWDTQNSLKVTIRKAQGESPRWLRRKIRLAPAIRLATWSSKQQHFKNLYLNTNLHSKQSKSAKALALLAIFAVSTSISQGWGTQLASIQTPQSPTVSAHPLDEHTPSQPLSHLPGFQTLKDLRIPYIFP